MVGRKRNWIRFVSVFWLNWHLAWALARLVPLVGVFVAFQIEWLPCGVIWSSNGLGGMLRFVQGSAQQPLPTTFLLFPSVAPTVRFRPRYMALFFPKFRPEWSETASD